MNPEITQAQLDTVTVDPVIFERWPEYRVLAIVARGLDRHATPITPAPLDLAEETIRAQNVTDWATHPHVAAWMSAFTGFGAKPKRTSPSVFALLKRVAAGLPRIDPVTDCYNAISISHVLPMGGENLDAYVGAPRLTIATGDEPFDTMESGEPVTDHPTPGEVIWRDDVGVTCRRWNWRQGVRTRIEPDTRNVLFILEALGPMDDAALLAAGEELEAGLRALSPNVEIGSRLIGRDAGGPLPLGS